MKPFLLILCAASRALSAPLDLPRVQRTDLEYLGSFALPADTKGTSRFGYGGAAVTPYTDPAGVKTLFLSGHAQQSGQLAQVKIPATLSKSFSYGSLPVASWVQAFANAVDGTVEAKAGITSGNGAPLSGTLAYNGRLIISAAEYYGCSQASSHGYSTLNLANTSDFKGFFKVAAAANVRATEGPMGIIPTAWRTLFGGPVLTGNWGLPIVSCLSAGPALTVFDPDALGAATPGTTILFYPLTSTENHALCMGTCGPSPETATSDTYNLTSAYGGLAFPSGTRSVLLFGRHGTGRYCYGEAAECGDPASSYKGPHAYPYRFQVWAYDAIDLLAVKAGTKKTYEPKPYAVWSMPELDPWAGAGHASIVSAGYDDDARRWYITTDYGEEPRVDVYGIKPLAAAPPDTVALPPPPKPDSTPALCRPDTIIKWFPSPPEIVRETVKVPEPYPVIRLDTAYIIPKSFNMQVNP